MTAGTPGAAVWQQAKTVIFVAILVLLAALVLVFRNEIVTAFATHTGVLLVVAGIITVSLALQAYNFLQLLGVQGSIPLRRTWHTWATANLVNYLGPFQPGLAVRAVFFKSYGVSIADTTRATLRQLLLSLWIGSGITVVGLFHDDAAIRLFSACACLVFVTAPWVVGSLGSVLSDATGQSRVIRVFRSVLDLGRLRMPLYRMWPFVMQYVFMALVFYISYNEFGFRLEPVESILLAVVFATSTLFAVAPNNLGLQEALVSFVAYQGGVGGGAALALALMFRVAHLLACAFVLLVTGRK